jgi:dinuclear metal center YbgI/SA1388 family protein
MLLKELSEKIAGVLPFQTAMSGDKIGIQISNEFSEVKGVLFCYEVTDDVITECVELQCNTIITFHPLIYHNLEHIHYGERVGRLCCNLIKNEINLISIHTLFDVYTDGTSSIFAELLDLTIKEILVPDKNYPNTGMGVITIPKENTNTLSLVAQLSSLCGCPVRYSGADDSELNRIAIVGGSGMSFLSAVIDKNCDCFITADCRYHDFHSVTNKLTLIDVGHYEMEQFVIKGMANILSSIIVENRMKYHKSKVNTNPVNYYPSNNYRIIQNHYLK